MFASWYPSYRIIIFFPFKNKTIDVRHVCFSLGLTGDSNNHNMTLIIVVMNYDCNNKHVIRRHVYVGTFKLYYIKKKTNISKEQAQYSHWNMLLTNIDVVLKFDGQLNELRNILKNE